MNGKNDYLTPPKELSIAYARASQRRTFSLLVGFDARLGQIIARDGEVVIAQMRMAWWRDAIAKSSENRPNGEPMVAQLNAIEAAGLVGISDAMGQIIDAWDLLLAHDEWNDDILLRHSELRGAAIFENTVGGKNSDNAADGQLWALHDLANLIDVNIGGAVGKCVTRPKQWRRPRTTPRHLSVLALAAEQQYKGGGVLCGLRLMLHGLTGL